MARSGYAANIEGLAQFSRALNRLSDDRFKNEIKTENFEVAKKFVEASQQKAAGLSRQQASAAKSLRATKTAAYSAIRMGSKRKPYALGAEFGAKRKTRSGKGIGGFQSWRGNQFGGWDGGPGYFLHPTIREEAPRLLQDYYDAIERISREAFPS